MSVKSTITAQFQQVAREQDRTLAPLSDELKLVQSGLDSIDILEIALVVSKQYGVQLRADSEENVRIFGSLRQLVDYIAAHRTK